MVSRAIKILSFQNFYEVLKTYSAGRKYFFDTLSQRRLRRRSCKHRILMSKYCLLG